MSTQTSGMTVHKAITVACPAEQAFATFTDGITSLWPLGTHSVGQTRARSAVFEGRVGGRLYEAWDDGTECDWGRILIWEPPRRFVMAWQITHTWGYEPDLAKSSEVEVRFTPESGGSTRVDIEHRYFNRHGEGGDTMRTAVDAPNGWSGLLQLFAAQAQQTN